MHSLPQLAIVGIRGPSQRIKESKIEFKDHEIIVALQAPPNFLHCLSWLDKGRPCESLSPELRMLFDRLFKYNTV